MTAIHGLIEDWIQMRRMLQQQVKLLEAGRMHTETDILGNTTEATIVCIKRLIEELNSLLKEHASADQP
jgi:hypothetical protein